MLFKLKTILIEKKTRQNRNIRQMTDCLKTQNRKISESLEAEAEAMIDTEMTDIQKKQKHQSKELVMKRIATKIIPTLNVQITTKETKIAIQTVTIITIVAIIVIQEIGIVIIMMTIEKCAQTG